MDTFELEREQGIVVVKPKARRLDASRAPAFRAEMLQLVQQGESRIVLDLADVDFIDSSGLGALVSVLKALGARGSLAVCGAGTSVVNLLKLTRMDRVFTVVPDRHAAAARLGDLTPGQT